MKGTHRMALVVGVFVLVAVFTMSALAHQTNDPGPDVLRGEVVSNLACIAVLAGGSACLLARRRRNRP